MPKYTIPALCWTSLKAEINQTKKGDAGIERNLEKLQVGDPSAKIQIGINIP